MLGAYLGPGPVLTMHWQQKGSKVGPPSSGLPGEHRQAKAYYNTASTLEMDTRLRKSNSPSKEGGDGRRETSPRSDI